ncbi:hypothetical protein N7U66_01750 [Lacinutrix neustonica]|uniref:Uncharacterized protein n=1 Tax=Lacinutrix neustonica TaxID=2980107 RepID=A0A9E8SE73_9FLAO|nr:hypothetical protein [Lacinutrix neustonica]WAC02462.1 hypothetical protein N7U66_01750 [Lacinutrix neustonica]
MMKKELVVLDFFKNKSFLDTLFYLSIFVSVMVSLFLEKKCLLYTVPVVIFIIFLKYISLTKKKANLLFVFALSTVIVSDSLAFYCFEDYFMWITLFTSAYLVCSTILLIKYLDKRKLKSLLSISLLIGFLLVAYLLYAILELLMNYIPDHLLFLTFLCASSLAVYLITISMVYVNDNYGNGVLLLISRTFLFFPVCFKSY